MCPYHGWQYGGDGVCRLIPQLPTRARSRARRGWTRSTAARRSGCCGSRSTSRATRSPRSRSSRTRTGSWSARARTRGTATRPASWRTSPTSGTSRGCIRACSATRRGRSSRSTPSTLGRARAALRDRPPGGAQQRRLPGVRQRADGRAGAPVALPADPAVHDPAAARLGRGEGNGLLLRLPARRSRALRGLRADRPQLRPTSSPRRSCRTSRTRSSTRTRWWSSRSARSGCRSTSRPRCT